MSITLKRYLIDEAHLITLKCATLFQDRIIITTEFKKTLKVESILFVMPNLIPECMEWPTRV